MNTPLNLHSDPGLSPPASNFSVLIGQAGRLGLGLEGFAAAAQYLTGASGAAVAVIQDDTMVCAASAGLLGPVLGKAISVTQGPWSECLRARRLWHCPDAEHDPELRLASWLGLRSALFLPISADSGVAGVLAVFSRNPFQFDEHDIAALEALVASAPEVPASVSPEPVQTELEFGEEMPEAAEFSFPALEEVPFAGWVGSEPGGVSRTRLWALGMAAAVLLAVSGLGLRPVALEQQLWRAGTVAKATFSVFSSEPLMDTAESKSVLPQEGEVSRDDRGWVRNVHSWTAPGYTLLILSLDRATTFHAKQLTAPHRIFFDLNETRLAPTLRDDMLEPGGDVVAGIRWAQNQPSVARVVLDLKSPARFTARMVSDPPELVVELYQEAGSLQVVRQEKSEEVPLGPETAAAAPPEGPLRIVLDPGHGGEEHGGMGPGGLVEKELVLSITRRLGELLRTRLGVEPIYTRRDDRLVPLEERTSFANQVQGELFLSIHANASRWASAHGIETYYYSPTSSEGAFEVAARENGSHERSSAAVLQSVVFRRPSERLARLVQRQLYRRLSRQNSSLRDRGVKRAPLAVLRDANMPAALVEIAFITNPSEARQLGSPAYQQAIAEALYQGISEFLAGENSDAVLAAQGGAR